MPVTHPRLRAVGIGAGMPEIRPALGDPRTEAMARRLIAGTLARHPEARVYALEWEGDRVPRGVEVEGRAIGWMQRGELRDAGNGRIGFYERTADCAGPTGKAQAAVIVLTCPPPEPEAGPSP